MQELLVDKIHFFKFLFMSEKPRSHQLKVITSTRSTVQASLTVWIFPSVRGIPSRKGKYPMLGTNTKPHQLIKHTKIHYSIVTRLFRKFSCGTHRNGLNRCTQCWGTPSTSKSTNRVSFIPFVGNSHFSILLHRVRYFKNLFMSRR